jgi:hypothetical protein
MGLLKVRQLFSNWCFICSSATRPLSRARSGWLARLRRAGTLARASTATAPPLHPCLAGGGVGVGWSSGRRHNEDAVRAAAQRRMGGDEPRKRRMRELWWRHQQLPATWRRRRARPCTGLGPGQGRILGGLNGVWWLSVVLILDWEQAQRLRVVPHRLDLCAPLYFAESYFIPTVLVLLEVILVD